MRGLKRKILLITAAATMAATALIPGSISAGQKPAGDGMPVSQQLIRILGGKAPAAVHNEAAPQVPAPVKKVVEAPKKAAAPTVEEIEDVGSDPSTWVGEVDVLGFDDLAPPAGPAASDAKCPKSTTCDTHLVRPQRWKTGKDGSLTIPWRFNDEGRRNLRAPAGLLESAVRSGMAEWSRWNSNVRFAYVGTTTAAFGAKGKDGSCSDGVNTITWTRFDPSIIAAVGTCIDPATNMVRDADLALNVTQHWENITGEAESRHTFDIRSIVTHELGHILSQLDLYDSDALHQTMMGNAEYGETRKRTLALGDIIGLQAAYPCGKGDVCPREGITDD
jgi:hypothetical protein